MTPQEQIDYVKYVVEHNPIKMVTCKSSHGIDLSLWEIALNELGIEHKKEEFVYIGGGGKKGISLTLINKNI